MTTAHIIILLVTGAGAGFASGLLGIGAAFIMTPVQFIIYTDMGIPIDIAIKLAFGTSLLVVLPTAASGTWRHHIKELVWWRPAIIMGSCSLVAAFGGATLATSLPGEVLKVAYGAVVMAGAIRMLTAKMPKAEDKPKDNPWLWAAWATLVGFVSGLIAIGGGILMIPILVVALRFKIHNAVATSLAMMIFTSIGGAIGYIVNGLDVPNLPAHSLGYVNLQSWLLLAATSIGMAQLGAITAHRLPGNKIKYIFIALMFYMGLKMLGVFEWLGWPI